MRLGYVTTYDISDRSTWPKTQVGICGAGYHLAETLENQSVSLDYLGPLAKKPPSLSHKFKWHFHRKLFKKDYLYFADKPVLEEYASRISKKLSTSDSNLLLCPENAVPISHLECKQPIVLWTDAPLAASINSYAWLSNLCDETKRDIYLMEKAALERCRLILFLSDWAAQTAISIYGIDPSKVKVIPWGANIECDRTEDDIISIVESRNINPCKLLFVGTDWCRKGGNMAFAVAKNLNEMGLNTELIVVGCQPILDKPIPKFVKALGFINKYTDEGLKQMNKLFADAHFLILPSTADFSPHVLCEANSFGLPCLATNIGGIPTIIQDGLNGKTFSLQSGVLEYCDYVTSLMTVYSEYKKLAFSSFNEYQTRLNWSVAGKTMKQLLTNLI